MMAAEQAVRARALALLRADAALGARVHGVFDGTPPRATPPYVAVEEAEGQDWGVKDRAGREVRLTLALVGVGPVDVDGAAARIEALVPMLRGAAGDWTIAGARVVRTRFAFVRDNGRGQARGESGWRHIWVVRCRCLAG
ncbi:tail completion protein gp17 [Sphingopyxis sp. MWB1]|uniref:tail completion protein gp17 n=1 Tax=Sphingopyxis sp. MWB1 TaxID=1537715 RepID=UPI00068F0124|nr:DUF3168 domain-containing protein [Sphingopyxis sp. MWB1]